MKKLTILIFFILTTFSSVVAQQPSPIQWSSDVQELGNNEFKLIFEAQIDKGWYLYSQDIEETPPIPTTFTLTASDELTDIGEMQEKGKLIEKYDEIFEKTIRKYANHVVFSAHIKTYEELVNIQTSVRYMACDKGRCLPPTTEVFAHILESEGLLVGSPMLANQSTYEVHKSKAHAKTTAPVNADYTENLKKKVRQNHFGDLLVAANLHKYIKSDVKSTTSSTIPQVTKTRPDVTASVSSISTAFKTTARTSSTSPRKSLKYLTRPKVEAVPSLKPKTHKVLESDALLPRLLGKIDADATIEPDRSVPTTTKKEKKKK